MAWERRETHEVGSYVFHWFHDAETGEWLIAIWNEQNAPEDPSIAQLRSALTLHHISREENPDGSLKPVRRFCQQFIEDIPSRIRAIRNKVPTLRRLEESGRLPSVNPGRTTGKGRR
ncbi:MAG: hypothetical protein KatS3mg115_0372 [Candidatus Poribacteria bacterium]|nr:MAG: hypothetical protein KatS3mg115_0372 [Candidatus Poribacteria bacterium]